MIPDSVKEKIKITILSIANRSIKDIFEEIEEDDKKELDRIICQDFLGLTEKDQLDLYDAISDLVHSRMERAKSVKTKKKKAKPSVIENLIKDTIEHLEPIKLGKFPEDYIDIQDFDILEFPHGIAKRGQNLLGPCITIDQKDFQFNSRQEVDFVFYCLINGLFTIKMPKDRILIKKAVKAYSKDFTTLQNKINEYVSTLSLTKKMANKVINLTLERILA
jgi:hypothetical protein